MQKQTQCGEADVIRRVTVRPVREEERGEFDFRLEEQHYLQSAAGRFCKVSGARIWLRLDAFAHCEP